MIKEIEPAKPAVRQVFCDITGEQLSWQALFTTWEHKPENKICPVVGCTIAFNDNYGALFDSVDEQLDIHLSENVTRELLLWLKEKYPDAPFIQKLNEYGI